MTDHQSGAGRNLLDQVDPRTFAAAMEPDGRQWIQRLPILIDDLCRRWQLERDDARVFHGYNAVVLLVRRNGAPLALKLTWPATGAIEEADALTLWNGRGMVRLDAVDADAGAVLLERLDPERTLMSLRPTDAAAVAGTLVRRLAIQPPARARSLRTMIADTGQTIAEGRERCGSPVPKRWLDEAVRLAGVLRDNTGTNLLIHADLHHGNILAGSREPWLAIDPRPVAGEPEASVPPLMWTRDDWLESAEQIRKMLAAVTAAGNLDPERTRQWVLVRCVDYLLWGLEHGLTHDPQRCRRILEAVA